jgi:ribosomal protein S18 acetylase RimI-like enzyme
MPAVVIRHLAAADAPHVVHIQRAITRREVSDRWKNMLNNHMENPDLPCLVAEEAGRVVGFIVGQITVGGFGGEVAGWIEMMGVSPEHMGAGIGRALAKAMIAYYREQEVEEVCTAVRWDSGDMLAFFKHLGFDRSPFINLRQVGS